MPGSIKIDDGSGNYTILTNAGSLGSDKTLTLPNTTGTLNVGGVQQIQESRVTSGTTASTSTSTWTDISGASVSITPASTSNDIICYATIPVEYTSTTHTAAAAVRIQSNHSGSYANVWGESGLTATMGVYNGESSAGSRSYHAFTTMFKFSPSTTSEFTIKAQLQTRYTTNNASSAGSVRGMTLVIGAIEVA